MLQHLYKPKCVNSKIQFSPCFPSPRPKNPQVKTLGNPKVNKIRLHWFGVLSADAIVTHESRDKLWVHSAWEQPVRPERSVSESSSSNCTRWYGNEESLVYYLNVFILILVAKPKLCLNVAEWVCTKSGGAGWKLWHTACCGVSLLSWGQDRGTFQCTFPHEGREAKCDSWQAGVWCSHWQIFISVDVKFPNRLLGMQKNYQMLMVW